MRGLAQLRRGGLAKRFAATIQRRPALFVGMAFYWFWTNLTFQMPIVSRQVAIYGVAMTSHALLLACNVLSYAVMIALFAWRRIEPKGAVGLWGTCISMSAGTLFLALWFWRTADLLGGTGPVDLVGQDTTATLFIVLGAALAGAGSAALCVEMQRVYGSLESDVILFHGVGSYAVSLLAVLVIGLLPLPAMLAAWVLSPLPAARCLLAEHGRLTHRELYARGEGAQLKLPRKLLVTSLLHGLSLGVLAGLPAMRGDASAVVLCVGASYLISSALAIVAAFGLRMNFNSLIYQTAFPIIAFGLYVMYAVGPDSAVGLSIDLVGFSYLHLVMWCVCSYLIKRFDMPSMWVTGTSTCFFYGWSARWQSMQLHDCRRFAGNWRNRPPRRDDHARDAYGISVHDFQPEHAHWLGNRARRQRLDARGDKFRRGACGARRAERAHRARRGCFEVARPRA